MPKMLTAYLLYCLLTPVAWPAHAQEWRYEGSREYMNSVFGGSWLDEQGNSYHNVQLSKLTSKSASATTGSRLMILDKNGRFKGIVQVSACQSRNPLLPFSGDRLLSLGHNCNVDTVETPDMRLFDKSGKLLTKGPSHGLFNMSTVRTESGYTAFLKNSFHAPKPVLEIRQIDWDFKVKTKVLKLSSYLVKGKKLGMVHEQPVQGSDGRWLVDAFLGTPQKDGGLTTDWPFVYLTDGNKLLGRFPKKNTINGAVFGTQAYQDGYAVMMMERTTEIVGDLVLYLLDSKANHRKTIHLPVLPSRFERFLIHHDHILLFSNDYDPQLGQSYVLRIFDMDGALVSERVLEENRARSSAVIPFGEKSIMVAGGIIPKKANNYSFVWKLDLELPNELAPTLPVAAVTEPELEPTPAPLSYIEDMTIDEVDERILSVAVFPNPASIFINFTLENPATPNPRYQLRVLSMNGRTVHQALLNQPSYELRIAELPPGTYSYQLQNLDDKKEVLTGKFVKV
ncbi:MAG: T9SS type A sorting domain-containing protein [Saprospiraceae bacterium]|nr:T9SS type A sorting domain-containing protein [Saprospiraceae bacterium]